MKKRSKSWKNFWSVDVKKEKFEIYVPVHLRKLRFEIMKFRELKEKEQKGIFRKFFRKG